MKTALEVQSEILNARLNIQRLTEQQLFTKNEDDHEFLESVIELAQKSAVEVSDRLWISCEDERMFLLELTYKSSSYANMRGEIEQRIKQLGGKGND